MNADTWDFADSEPSEQDWVEACEQDDVDLNEYVTQGDDSEG